MQKHENWRIGELVYLLASLTSRGNRDTLAVVFLSFYIMISQASSVAPVEDDPLKSFYHSPTKVSFQAQTFLKIDGEESHTVSNP